MKQNTLIESIKSVAKRIKKTCPVGLKLSHAHTGIARALGFQHWHDLATRLQDGLKIEARQHFRNLEISPGSDGLCRAAGRFAEASGIDADIAKALCGEFLLPAMARWCAEVELPAASAQSAFSQQLRSHDRLPARQPVPELTDPPVIAVSVDDSGLIVMQKQQTSVEIIRKKRRSAIQRLENGALQVNATPADAGNRPKYTLSELIMQMPDGAPIDREWESMAPVGKEIL